MQSTLTTFSKPFVPFLYDVLVRSIYWPVGGEPALREDAVSHLGLSGGERILELGCGTGSFTRLLVAQGARVASIDGSSRMIARARLRAPGAAYQVQDLRTLQLDTRERFDFVLMAFVLHELEPKTRLELFERAALALAPNGKLAVVDHAVPAKGGYARVWRRFLLSLEPPTVRAAIESGYRDELERAGLRCTEPMPLARGTAQMVLAHLP
jgi:ubiquinone/menaquinone biosynthesis C-methylase UbiE